jgi:two-component system cell cycle sensor histidine kinase/response regulator CckA
VYGIVKQSGGFIWVYSEKGHGTTFKLYFPPAAAEKQQGSSLRSETSLATLAGNESILLVEDENALRQATRAFLETSGYTVLEASHALEAITIARNNPGIDLLLTDVVMPGMSGRQLSEELCHLFPGLRVLYMTGYTDDMVVHHGVLQEGVSLVQKPFTRITLLKQVRKILDQEF